MLRFYYSYIVYYKPYNTIVLISNHDNNVWMLGGVINKTVNIYAFFNKYTGLNAWVIITVCGRSGKW